MGLNLTFVKSLEKPLSNLLILAGDYFGWDFDYTTRSHLVLHENFNDILNEKVYGYGDFCWVDFENVESLGLLEPIEVAELLYLGHLFKPVKSAFFDKLQNRFAYLAHDDGWFNKFYCRDIKEFSHSLGSIVSQKASKEVGENELPLIQLEITDHLLELSEQGLLIDIDGIIKDGEGYLEIPFHVVGKDIDSDTLYNNLKMYLSKAASRAYVVFSEGKWSIETFA